MAPFNNVAGVKCKEDEVTRTIVTGNGSDQSLN